MRNLKFYHAVRLLKFGYFAAYHWIFKIWDTALQKINGIYLL